MNRKGNRGFADTEKLNRIGLSNWSFQWRTTAQCLNMAICISTLLVLYETAAGQPNQQLSIRTGISGLSSEFQREHRVVTPYNARSCAECHSTPKIGGSSPVTVIRAGDRIVGRYDGVGESVTIHKHGETGRPHDPQIMKLRVALNLLGDGYVEAVPDRDLQAIAKSQVVRTHGVVRGQAPLVTVLHATDAKKAEGRFGWKDQHASLLSAAADALNNELGVPNRYFPADLAGNAAESSDNDSELFSLVSFIRSTEPVAPDTERSAGESAQAGSEIFDRIGCSICHVRTLKTAPPGTPMEGGVEIVPERLGNKEIHPYSDFLLHDVGTGDGIVQNIRPSSAAPG